MKRMKTDRSLVRWILLGILTLGIYDIWFLHHLVKDINELCREDGKKSSGVLIYFLLSLVTCGLYSVFWWYRIGDMLAGAVRRRQLRSSVSGSSVLICMILNCVVCGLASYVAVYHVIEATNELAVDYNNRLFSKSNLDLENINA